MRLREWSRLFCLGVAGFAACAFAGPAKGPSLAVLGVIEPGQWELHEVGSTAPARLFCLRDPDMLIQLRHTGAQCARFVIENRPDTATVNYDCDGAGSGRTTISLDTPRQLRLQTQGIARAAPFDIEYSGHRLGNCAAAPR